MCRGPTDGCHLSEGDLALAPQSAFIAQPTGYLLGELVETAMLLDETEWDVIWTPEPTLPKYTAGTSEGSLFLLLFANLG